TRKIDHDGRNQNCGPSGKVLEKMPTKNLFILGFATTQPEKGDSVQKHPENRQSHHAQSFGFMRLPKSGDRVKEDQNASDAKDNSRDQGAQQGIASIA